MLSGRNFLIVEDDLQVRHALASLVSAEGGSSVEIGSLAEFEIAWQKNNFDFVLLDLNLPDGDGLNILRRSRRDSDVPILILTGKSDEIDEVLGLELGATDYVIKPFRQRSLLARISRALRQTSDFDSTNDDNQISRFEIQGWRFDADRRGLISPDGTRVQLTTAEYRLLGALFEARDQVLSRKELSAIVFGREIDEDSRSIDTLVSRLRTKLDSVGTSETIIRTVVGVGYTFNMEFRHASKVDEKKG